MLQKAFQIILEMDHVSRPLQVIPRSLRREAKEFKEEGVSRRAEDVSKVDLVWSSYDSSAIKCHLNDFRCVS